MPENSYSGIWPYLESHTLKVSTFFLLSTEAASFFFRPKLPSQQEQEWDFNEVEEEFEITSKAAPPKRPRRKNLPKFRDPARVRPIIKYNDCSQV